MVKYIRGINLIGSSTGLAALNNYYVFNANGDVVQLTNTAGNVTKSYVYDAFGVEQSPDPNDTNPFRYGAEYFDRETNNYYLRARFYTQRLGRFTSEDPYWNTGNVLYGDDPQKTANGRLIPNIHAIRQSSNLYVYCMSNPIAFIDPSGLFIKHIANFFDNLADSWSSGVADLKGSNNAILRGFGNFSQGYANISAIPIDIANSTEFKGEAGFDIGGDVRIWLARGSLEAKCIRTVTVNDSGTQTSPWISQAGGSFGIFIEGEAMWLIQEGTGKTEKILQGKFGNMTFGLSAENNSDYIISFGSSFYFLIGGGGEVSFNVDNFIDRTIARWSK
ncbi:MAG: RHS repeat-associated core domain-containing protein [Oscillospiraceae bacterium]|jgi:RHS repeat-associated protein|nr:RHS repeat-associated core domain-containing protein [Oscillospiraceae bacterium]